MEINAKIITIKNLAYKISKSINLFNGYCPKTIDKIKGEALFWRYITNIYGLLHDCDIFQVKGTKKSLFELFKEYDLINDNDYYIVNNFFRDISSIRSWYCHNNNPNLYFCNNDSKRIQSYINTSFSIASNKPNSFDEVSGKDWDLLNNYIIGKFNLYLDILEVALKNWFDSTNRIQITSEWYLIYSEALYNNKELLRNVLASYYEFQILLSGMKNKNIKLGIDNYMAQLKDADFSVKDIEDVVKGCEINSKSAVEIINISFQRVNLHIV